MNNNPPSLFNRRRPRTDRQPASEALEARLGARLASGLTLRSQALPHDLSERLRVAREQAVSRAREKRVVAPTAATAGGAGVVGITAGGAAVLGRFGAGPSGSTPWWQRAASVLPILVLAMGLVMINQATTREQVRAAAEIDSQLLADDLPPAAYSDPGFAEFLRSDSTPAP